MPKWLLWTLPILLHHPVIPINCFSSVGLWHCILRHSNTSNFPRPRHPLSLRNFSVKYLICISGTSKRVTIYHDRTKEQRSFSHSLWNICSSTFTSGKCLNRVVPECSRLIRSQREVCLLAKLHSGTCRSPWCCRTHSAGSSFLCSSGWGASYPPSQYRKYLPVRLQINSKSWFLVLDMGWDQVTPGMKIENHWELNIQLLRTRSNHNDLSRC